jgi:hypothetical protein
MVLLIKNELADFLSLCLLIKRLVSPSQPDRIDVVTNISLA